jgi:hypothetical protein
MAPRMRGISVPWPLDDKIPWYQDSWATSVLGIQVSMIPFLMKPRERDDLRDRFPHSKFSSSSKSRESEGPISLAIIAPLAAMNQLA